MQPIFFLLCKYYVINVGLSFITYVCAELNISCAGLIPYGRRSSAACLKIGYAENTPFMLNLLLTACIYCPLLSGLVILYVINSHVYLDYIGDVVQECTTLLLTVRQSVLCDVVWYCDWLNVIVQQFHWLFPIM
jgi:hypothetical protein